MTAIFHIVVTAVVVLFVVWTWWNASPYDGAGVVMLGLLALAFLIFWNRSYIDQVDKRPNVRVAPRCDCRPAPSNQ